MSTEPGMNEDYGMVTPPPEPQFRSGGAKRLPPGTFVGREEEQDRFRQMLLDLAGRKGMLGGLLGGGGANKGKVKEPIKSRVLLVTGPAGSGKTGLTARLREIAQKEKEFSRRFRTTRLDWGELFERDGRLTALLEGQAVPPEALLDLINNHCYRDNGGGYFEQYRQAIEETKKLARSVAGAELAAVWEFRARALGRSLKEWSGDRPLIFFMDNFELVAGGFEAVFQPMLEESGSQVFFVLSGEGFPSNFKELVAPERFALVETGPFGEAELRHFYELELARYEVSQAEDAIEYKPAYRSPDLIAQLESVTGGLPLAARFSAFLLQTGLTVSELSDPSSSNPAGEAVPVERLTEIFVDGPLGPGHPDRLKLYALALLRRPEPGLLAALLTTRQDMLPVDEVLLRLNERYSFLFEPGRQMTLHTAVGLPLRRWLLDPSRRYDETGLARLNEYGLDYLETRLEDWSVTFPTLPDRLLDLTWREWALDQVWHSFWLSEERGWPYALALLVGGLKYRPAVARQVVASLQSLARLGALNETSLRRLELFRQAVLGEAGAVPALRELRVMGQEGGFFKQAMPKFAGELAGAIDDFVS